MDKNSKIPKKIKKKHILTATFVIAAILLAVVYPDIKPKVAQYAIERKLYDIQIKRPDAVEVIGMLGKPETISTTNNGRFTIFDYPCAKIIFHMEKLSTIRCKEGYSPKPPGYRAIWHKIRFRKWPVDTRIS